MIGIITGATSGIGKAIKDELEKKGFEIITFKSRLQNIKSIETEIKGILKIKEINFLINSAGVGLFEPLETVSIKRIED